VIFIIDLESEDDFMKKLITIGRLYGSGGSEVAVKLAERLNIKCYDKEILLEAAKKSGIYEGVADQYDIDGQQSYFYSLIAKGQAGKIINQPLNAQIHNEQFQLIKSIAKEEGEGIFLGRCADYVLREFDDVLDVYLKADLDDRVTRIAEKQNMEEAKAYKLIMRRDNQREAYYNYYTNKKWSDLNSYDLCINLSDVGMDGAVDIILNYMEIKEKNK